MGYKSKTCPKCGVTHNKRGEFCSRSCGNTRKHKPETKKKIGEAKHAWLTSGDERAEAEVHNFTSLGANKTPEPVAPIVSRDVGHKRFVEDGDLWEEVQLQETLPFVTPLCGCMWEVYVETYVTHQCMGSRVGVYALSSGHGCNIAILI